MNGEKAINKTTHLQKDFYKECGIDETMLWSNNKRRSKGLPMFRQCGYHKRKKDIQHNYLRNHRFDIFNTIENMILDIYIPKDFFNCFVNYEYILEEDDV